MREVYCDRLADVTVTEGRDFGHCAECGESVTSTEEPDVRLICTRCLVGNAPITPAREIHNYRGHCAMCFLGITE